MRREYGSPLPPPKELRRLHSAYVRGLRLDDVLEGERAYQTWRKRLTRSGLAMPQPGVEVDLTSNRE